MIITVDRGDVLPMYEQLRRQIVAGVARGELMPGDALPSVRALAQDLGINLHTVNKAYAMLRDEGHVVMRRGSGATIAPRDAGSPSQQQEREMQRMRDELYRIAMEYRAQGGTFDGFMAEAERHAARAFQDEAAERPAQRREDHDDGHDPDGSHGRDNLTGPGNGHGHPTITNHSDGSGDEHAHDNGFAGR